MHPQRFRISSKSLALTYPQCDLGKGEALGLLGRKLEDYIIEDYLVAQELHKDGKTHLHMYIKLNKVFDSKNPECLDLLNFHGHYKSCSKTEGWISYLLKEDTEPLMSQDFKLWVKNSAAHKKRNANQEKYETLMRIGPHKMCKQGDFAPNMINQWVKAYETLQALEAQEQMAAKEELPDELPNTWGIRLQINTDKKQCHFWIYSTKPNFGKTTFMLDMLARYRASQYNTGELYQNQISKDTELVIFDEFTGGIPVCKLNQICDGTFLFPQKFGLKPTMLNQKPLVIILGNRAPEECYEEKHLSVLMARFNLIDLENSAQDFANIIKARNPGNTETRNGGELEEEEEKNGQLDPLRLLRCDATEHWPEFSWLD